MTNWTPVTKNSTNWSGTSINPTDYTPESKTITNWQKGKIFSNNALLLQDGSFLLMQNGTDKLGLQN
jgi:hypothetical protein